MLILICLIWWHLRLISWEYSFSFRRHLLTHQSHLDYFYDGCVCLLLCPILLKNIFLYQIHCLSSAGENKSKTTGMTWLWFNYKRILISGGTFLIPDWQIWSYTCLQKHQDCSKFKFCFPRKKLAGSIPGDKHTDEIHTLSAFQVKKLSAKCIDARNWSKGLWRSRVC